MNKKYILYYLIMFLVVLNACEWLWGYKDLGGGYFFYKDGDCTNIIFNDNAKDGRHGSGLEIIPPIVVNVEYNKSYIIAKNIDYETKSRNFWIIEKDKALSIEECKTAENFDQAIKSNVIGPLDSTSFYIQLNKKNISLDFN